MKRNKTFCIMVLAVLMLSYNTVHCQDIFTDIKTGAIDNLKRYIKNGGDVNAKDTSGRTLLIWAALIRDADFIKLLIDSKADVNNTQKGFSALMAATLAGNKESVKLLIDAGADVNKQNEQGYTPLMMAASAGDVELVKMLLKGKADPMIEDNKGNTAFDLASEKKLQSIAIMLLYPAKRLSAWNQIIPDHITASYITKDNFNRRADTNAISMKLDIGKKRAFEFYREKLIEEEWRIDQYVSAENEEGTLTDKALWGIIQASKNLLTLIMNIRSDQFAEQSERLIATFDRDDNLQEHYTQTSNTIIDVILVNRQPKTTSFDNLPKVKEISELNQRFTSHDWGVTLNSVVNEGNVVSNRDNITGSVYSFKIKTPNFSLLRAKIKLERLDGKPIKQSFISVEVKVMDIQGNVYPAIAAGTGTAEFYDIIRGGIQSIMIPMQPESDVEYVFGVPEGSLISKLIWPGIEPIDFPEVKAHVTQTSDNAKNKIITKTYDNGKYVGEMMNNKAHGKGTYTWTSGSFAGDKYVGNFIFGTIHGQGTYTWANGDMYTGEWKNTTRCGMGTFVSNDGSKYVGEWKNSMKNGKGEKTWKNGDVYSGEWINDKRNGRGTYTWTDNNQYIGDWKDNLMTGQGTFTWSNGNVYKGEWENDMRNGKGILTWANGSIFEGEWTDNKMKKGILTYCNGDKYSGTFKENLQDGKGTYIWENGDYYKGEWKENKMFKGAKFNKEGEKIAYYSNAKEHLIGKWVEKTKDGKGTYIWANGDKYTGECKDGIKSGIGEKTWADGDKYEGEWENDMRNGQGTYTWKDGDTYTGEFKNNIRHGQGVYTWKDGDRFEGEWKDGKRYNGIMYNKEGDKIATYKEGIKR